MCPRLESSRWAAAPGAVTVAQAEAALRLAARDGRLARLAEELNLDLVVLHGSARHDPATAADLDVAYLPTRGADVDLIAVEEAFARLIPGDHLDLMPLPLADPVAAWAALGRGEMLLERTPGLFAERRIRAFGDYRDTQKFRDLALRMVGRS